MNFEEFGGIKFNAEDVLSKKSIGDKFILVLVDGTEVEYSSQSEDRYAEIYVRSTGRTDFYGLKDAVIKDTSVNDVYRLLGCENVTVKADRGYQLVDGKLIGSDRDLVEVYNRVLENGNMQYSINNTLRLNLGDLYKLPEQTSVHYVSEANIDINECR